MNEWSECHNGLKSLKIKKVKKEFLSLKINESRGEGISWRFENCKGDTDL